MQSKAKFLKTCLAREMKYVMNTRPSEGMGITLDQQNK